MTTATTNPAAPATEVTTPAAAKPMNKWVKRSIWGTVGVAALAAVGFGVKVYLGRNSGN